MIWLNVQRRDQCSLLLFAYLAVISVHCAPGYDGWFGMTNKQTPRADILSKQSSVRRVRTQGLTSPRNTRPKLTNSNPKNDDNGKDDIRSSKPSVASQFYESFNFTDSSSLSSSSEQSLNGALTSTLPSSTSSLKPSSTTTSESASPESTDDREPLRQVLSSPIPFLPTRFPAASEGVLSQDMMNIVASNNIFGFKLYNVLPQFHANENIFISPLSLFSTLITVYAGSSSSTEEEMISLLRLRSMTESQIQTAFRDVLHTLMNDIGPQNKLKLLSAILVDNELNVSSSYVDKVRTYYNAYVDRVGFASEPAYVATLANNFVNRWTQGLIPTIIDAPLDPLTRLLLINVISFKGAWQEPFKLSLTTDSIPFHNFDGSTSKVNMMRASGIMNYHCDFQQLKACFVEKTYSGSALSFFVMVPTNGTDTSSLDALLGTEQMNEVFGRLKPTEIEFGLPRFSISGSYDLLKPLEYLGMKKAFSSKKADLSKMGPSKELFVKEARHKTALQVTEEGTTAAAATVAEIGSRRRSPRVVVDRPFLFQIRDLRTDAILFLGKINSL